LYIKPLQDQTGCYEIRTEPITNK